MKYRTFGRLGWKLSEIGFGAWALGGQWGTQSDDDSVTALHRAIELGCNFIDTAQAYGNGRSEQVIGQVLKERRHDRRIYIATKIKPAVGTWPPSPYDQIADCYPEPYLRLRVEDSLRNLKSECIDLIQLHSWTRAWNRDPVALRTLRTLQREGKVRAIGISAPEPDQNAVNDLMRDGWLDSVQVVYNIFDQEAQAEIFPTAAQNDIGVIVRVPFDEGSLTGKFTLQTTFDQGDFRSRYFGGDRLGRTVQRIERIREVVGASESALATAALKFALKPMAVSTVIPGMRNVRQAEMNLAISDMPEMPDHTECLLREHLWRRSFWYTA